MVALEPPDRERVPVLVSGDEQDNVAVMDCEAPAAMVPDVALNEIHDAAEDRLNDPEAFPVLVMVNSCVASASPNVWEVENVVWLTENEAVGGGGGSGGSAGEPDPPPPHA